MEKRIKLVITMIFVFLFSVSALAYLAGKRNLNVIQINADDVAEMPVVVIDAGHGGADGGASSFDGTSEKNINLAIALKLEKILNSMGISTVMTRTQDISIHDDDAKTLRQKKVSDIHNRLKIIEQNDDAIFVSIHLNHFSSPSSHGTQVFYSTNNNLGEALASNIQASVINFLQPDNKRKIKKAGTNIYLLYHAPIPAVMVECGFLSNYNDTQKLKDVKYQSQMAFSITHGILEYLNCSEEF
jgi:N-acetylmuramoyl-L-alanine amidase